MEENFRLELLSMIDRFADDNTVMMIDGCVCRLLRKYDVSEKHTEICVLENENEKILNTYRASLRLEGRSPSTIYQYMDSIKHTLAAVFHIEMFFHNIHKFFQYTKIQVVTQKRNKIRQQEYYSFYFEAFYIH